MGPVQSRNSEKTQLPDLALNHSLSVKTEPDWEGTVKLIMKSLTNCQVNKIQMGSENSENLHTTGAVNMKSLTLYQSNRMWLE